MADLKLNWAKKEQEKRQQFCEFYILFYILFYINVKCSGQLRDIKVLFEKPFDYDISCGSLTHPLSPSPSTDHA